MFKLFELELYLGRLHVLSVRQDDYLLATSCDDDAPGIVKASEVASVYKAVGIDGLRRRFRAVVVTEHYVRSLSAKLAHIGGAAIFESLLVCVDELALHRRQGEANAAGDIVAGAREGDDWRSLCHAVAFEQFESEGLEPISYLGIESRSAAYAEAYVATHLFVYLGKDDARESLALHLGAEGKKGAGQSRSIDLLHDAAVERLPEAWHTDKDSYAPSTQGVHDVGAGHARCNGHTATDGDGGYHRALQWQYVV